MFKGIGPMQRVTVSEEDRDVLDRILYTADGFAAGLETGLLLAKEGSEQL